MILKVAKRGKQHIHGVRGHPGLGKNGVLARVDEGPFSVHSAQVFYWINVGSSHFPRTGGSGKSKETDSQGSNARRNGTRPPFFRVWQQHGSAEY